jgi:hypothetical protein
MLPGTTQGGTGRNSANDVLADDFYGSRLRPGDGGVTPAEKARHIDGLLALEYDSLGPAEKLTLDMHRSNIALKKALDTKNGPSTFEKAYQDAPDKEPFKWQGEGHSAGIPVLTDPIDPWEHRSEGMKCSTCMWYVQKGPPNVEMRKTKGRCRKHAPTMTGYPIVYMNDWCGDHKLA